jgi:hypothetical protein
MMSFQRTLLPLPSRIHNSEIASFPASFVEDFSSELCHQNAAIEEQLADAGD